MTPSRSNGPVRVHQLTPLLMPSGPRWSEKWADTNVPELILYDYWVYRSTWEQPFDSPGQSWPDGAWVLRPAAKSPLSWLPYGWRVGFLFGRLQRIRSRRNERLKPKATPMGWRFAIGPDLTPWEPGDPQPQAGAWPISIAVFGAEQVAAADAIHTGRMRAHLGSRS